MKVAIINNTFAGKQTEVHAPGCADVPKAEKRNHDEAWVVDVESLVDLSMTYWADQIGDTVEDLDSDEAWATAETWSSEFNVKPCVEGLPHTHRDEAPATEDEAPADEATEVTTWVGKALAAKITEVYPNTHSLATKVREAKVTKAGDRTIKFTAEEATQLREFCGELEVQGGSLAYSARTLRARLA